MASFASLSASEIIGLTPDDNHDTKEEEMQEFVEEIDMAAAAAAASDNIIKHSAYQSDNDDPVPFCTSGSMHGTTMYSYAMYHGGMNGSSGGMVMYMDGFRLSLKGGQPCLNLFFESWTLDTRTKFLLAMMSVAFLGIVTEFISKLRSQVSQQRHSCRRRKRILIPMLHGLQALVGYMCMLATMTFSIELFCSVLLGLGVGYSIFYSDDDWHVTTNPCCNFMQDEANERNDEAQLEIRLKREELIEHQRNEDEEVDLFHVARQVEHDDKKEENAENGGITV